MNNTDITTRLNLAKTIARSAGDQTLKYFQTDKFKVVLKSDGSPLTIADQETETYLRAQISAAFPNDAIVGEEFGVTEGTSGFRWALDPIDGTKSFIHGVPLYGTMVAVIDERDPHNHRAVIGVIHIPGLKEGAFAATGLGAWHYHGDGEPIRARVSQVTDLSQATFVTTAIEGFGQFNANEAFLKLSASVKIARTWGDVYGYLLVATGRADFMIDPELNIWDAAAVQPIIEEAGGKFTDWDNVATFAGGNSVGSNGQLHDAVLSFFRKHQS